MLKALGAALILAGGAALGAVGSCRLSHRARLLRSLCGDLRQIERELAFRLTPLPALFSRLGQARESPTARFFKRCADGLGNVGEVPLCSVWEQAVTEEFSQLPPDDRAILTELSLVLGRYNDEDQRRALSGAAERLDEKAREAEAERDKLGKVYGALGLTVGAFLVILLL